MQDALEHYLNNQYIPFSLQYTEDTAFSKKSHK